MSTKLIELVVSGGIPSLHCPITGRPVVTSDDGFDPQAVHTPYLRVFVDWIGQVWAPFPKDLPENQRSYQTRIIEIWQDSIENEDQNSRIARCVEEMPESVIFMEIQDPPCGSYGGSTCYAAFDLAGGTESETIQLQEIT
jgi:hypothetical protein